jgi:hypothetical protein
MIKGQVFVEESGADRLKYFLHKQAGDMALVVW